MFLICLVAFSFFPILAEINGPRNTNLSPKSLLRSPAAGDFYATGIEIWAGFELIGSTEKKRSESIMSDS